MGFNSVTVGFSMKLHSITHAWVFQNVQICMLRCYAYFLLRPLGYDVI